MYAVRTSYIRADRPSWTDVTPPAPSHPSRPCRNPMSGVPIERAQQLADGASADPANRHSAVRRRCLHSRPTGVPLLTIILARITGTHSLSFVNAIQIREEARSAFLKESTGGRFSEDRAEPKRHLIPLTLVRSARPETTCRQERPSACPFSTDASQSRTQPRPPGKSASRTNSRPAAEER